MTVVEVVAIDRIPAIHERAQIVGRIIFQISSGRKSLRIGVLIAASTHFNARRQDFMVILVCRSVIMP
jgi:hypothetical protein